MILNQRGRDEIAKLLARTRTEAGVTQGEIARRLDLLSAQYVSNCERAVCSPSVAILREYRIIARNPETFSCRVTRIMAKSMMRDLV